MGAICLTGKIAALEWGYHRAATVKTWTVRAVQGGGGHTLVGLLADVDAFRLQQRPLVFVVRHAGGVWRWPVLALTIAEKAIEGRLGAIES